VDRHEHPNLADTAPDALAGQRHVGKHSHRRLELARAITRSPLLPVVESGVGASQTPGGGRMSDRAPGSWTGRQLGSYRVGPLIGRGSMGEVYAAEDTGRGRTIALKLLWADLSRDEGFRERMHREARTAGRLQDPHVVPIHDYGVIDGHLFLDMRLINGSDLAAVLKRSGPLTAARAVSLVRQAASALDAAHTVGVIHRDIKPANLLLSDKDFVYLVDFGIASAVGDEPLEAPKTIEGTWKYAAPELFTGNEVGPSIDIYALSAVLYECLTGMPPYRAEGVQGFIAAHVNEPVPRPSWTAGVSPAFDEVIARGMAKDAAERYPSAGELARAAQQALQVPAPGHQVPNRGSAAGMGAPLAMTPHQWTAPPAAQAPPAAAWAQPGPPPPGLPYAAAQPARARGHSGDWSKARTRVGAPAFQRNWPRHGPRIAAAATALIAVIALMGWMTRSNDDQPDSPGSSTDQSAGRSAAAEQLTKVIPTGYPAGRCEVVAAQAGAVTEMDCGRNIEVGGPVAATYTLYQDRGALRAAFQALVEKSRAVTCPGRIQSPGAWHRASTPPGKSDGMLLCGFRQNLPRIVWTAEADLLLSDVQADERAATFEPLFAWWGTHS
jgi:hypothetical protein